MKEAKVTLVLSVVEVNTILNALAGQPYAEVAPLLERVSREAQAQLEADDSGE